MTGQRCGCDHFPWRETLETMGLTRFDGHPRYGVKPRERMSG
jgi:hypothetical protein